MTTETANTNQFRALLGKSFDCPYCYNTHPPNSVPARACANHMADPIRQRYPPPTFEPGTKRYFARQYWYQRHARWTPEQDSREADHQLAERRNATRPNDRQQPARRVIRRA